MVNEHQESRFRNSRMKFLKVCEDTDHGEETAINTETAEILVQKINPW